MGLSPVFVQRFQGLGCLRAEFVHLSGVREAKDHHTSSRYPTDGSQGAGLIIKGWHSLTGGHLGMEHEWHRMPTMGSHHGWGGVISGDHKNVWFQLQNIWNERVQFFKACLLYTSDAADE